MARYRAEFEATLEQVAKFYTKVNMAMLQNMFGVKVLKVESIPEKGGSS